MKGGSWAICRAKVTFVTGTAVLAVAAADTSIAVAASAASVRVVANDGAG